MRGEGGLEEKEVVSWMLRLQGLIALPYSRM